ncbi:MAG: type II toxin-antitoxin system HicB family antitoxin [Candidatus Thorarchaeota archaeon]
MLEKEPTGGYIAICPSFQGCYSQGEIIEDALDNIKEAIELCIVDLKVRGYLSPILTTFLWGVWSFFMNPKLLEFREKTQ